MGPLTALMVKRARATGYQAGLVKGYREGQWDVLKMFLWIGAGCALTYLVYLFT